MPELSGKKGVEVREPGNLYAARHSVVETKPFEGTVACRSLHNTIKENQLMHNATVYLSNFVLSNFPTCFGIQLCHHQGYCYKLPKMCIKIMCAGEC
jgi:hypothetical protein